MSGLHLGARQRSSLHTTAAKIKYAKEKAARAQALSPPPSASKTSPDDVTSRKPRVVVAADPRLGGIGHKDPSKRVRLGKGRKMGVEKREGRVPVRKGRGKGRAVVKKVQKSEEFVVDEEWSEDDGRTEAGEEGEENGGERIGVDDEDEQMGGGDEDVDDGNEGDVEDEQTTSIDKDPPRKKRKRLPSRVGARSVMLEGFDINFGADENYTTDPAPKEKPDTAPEKITKPKKPKMQSYLPPEEKLGNKSLTKKQRDAIYKRDLAGVRQAQLKAQREKAKAEKKASKIAAAEGTRLADKDQTQGIEEGQEHHQDKSVRAAIEDTKAAFTRAKKAMMAKPQRESVLMRKTAKAERALIQQRREVLASSDVKHFMQNSLYTDAKQALNKYKGDIARIEKNFMMRGRITVLQAPKFSDVCQKLIDCGDFCAPSLKTPVQVFDVMNLPQKIRQEVWQHAVVDDKFLVWPERKVGAEQPDLAMVSKQVREEVLPIYYSENIFAVELKGSGTAEEDSDHGLRMLERFAEAMEPGDWLQHVRHWIFSCTVTQSEWLVDADDDGSHMVSLKISGQGEDWSAKLEVHKDVQCFKAVDKSIRPCVAVPAPQWMAAIAADFCAMAAADGKVTGDMLASVGRSIRARKGNLEELWCN